MATYYVDAVNGDNKNSGLSESEPLKDDSALIPNPGDSVLFKRGTLNRGVMHNISGAPGIPIRYAAYGQGEPPVFSGSIDCSSPDDWVEESEHFWICKNAPEDEVGNIIFNGGTEYGTFRWTKEECVNQGDFYDNCCGFRNKKKAITSEHRLYLYSEQNPAELYSSIEVAFFGDRIMVNNGHDMLIENLKFINAGVHALGGETESRNLIIRNCVFENIGGGVWNSDLKIRYGNAVEFWNVAENIEVTGCIFNNIYDSAVTHQGMEQCEPCVNVNIHNNIFIKCGMAAYEQRDRLPKSASFCQNICIDAGNGFSKQGEVMPRFSEIWPQPMGHHVFLWRIDESTEDGRLVIADNVFYNAAYGAAMYSISCEEAERLVDCNCNLYYTENSKLLCRWFGKNFSTFEDWSSIDKNSKYDKLEAEKILKERISVMTNNEQGGILL